MTPDDYEDRYGWRGYPDLGEEADDREGVTKLSAEVERLREINKGLVNDHNTLLLDGVRLEDALRIAMNAFAIIQGNDDPQNEWARSIATQAMRETNTERYRPLRPAPIK